MHSKILAIAVGTSLAVASFGAEALPAGPVAGASTESNIHLTAGGCGPGFAPGPAGVCRRIVVGRPVVVVPPRVVVRRPVAPCGVRVGPVAVRTGC